jgi:hypothetical protein
VKKGVTVTRSFCDLCGNETTEQCVICGADICPNHRTEIVVCVANHAAIKVGLCPTDSLNALATLERLKAAHDTIAKRSTFFPSLQLKPNDIFGYIFVVNEKTNGGKR